MLLRLANQVVVRDAHFFWRFVPRLLLRLPVRRLFALPAVFAVLPQQDAHARLRLRLNVLRAADCYRLGAADACGAVLGQAQGMQSRSDICYRRCSFS